MHRGRNGRRIATSRGMRIKARLRRRLKRALDVSALEGQLGETTQRLEAREADIRHVWKLLDGHEERIGRAERLIRTATVMAWIEQAALATRPLVTVILPTRDRAELLARAIGSVRAQSYDNWELVVSDDGMGKATGELVASVGDDRIQYVRGGPSTAGAARNRGLDVARGELIAYLDDDNVMHRNWVKSVVWAFEQRPAVELLHGGVVIDDTARHHGEDCSEMPSAWVETYDPETIQTSNVADSSAIAHRANLAAARWDGSLTTMADWDFFLRASARTEPLTLPVIACFYYTDGDGRLSELKDDLARDLPLILERAARDRA